MNDPQRWLFAYSAWLWGIPAIAALGAALWVFWRRLARRRLSRFVAPRHLTAAVPTVNWRRRAAQFGLAVTVLMLLATALARPLRGPLPDKAEAKGVDFVVALDISKSMLTEDVVPNRLAAVKAELGRWLEERRGDRMGLVLFAGDAIVQAPITHDFVALNHVLRQASPKSMSIGGTNIPRAVEAATDLLRAAEPRSRVLVIISDGENLEGDAINAVREARNKESLTVFTIGVGTISGGRVPVEDYAAKKPPADGKPIAKNYVQNEYGLIVTSRLDNRMLKLIADAGGGRYFEFRPELKTFDTFYSQSLASQAQQDQTLDVREYAEWFQLPLGVAIALIMLVPLLSLFRKRPAALAAGVEVVMPETLSKPNVRAAFLRAGSSACLAFVISNSAIAAPGSPVPPTEQADALFDQSKPDDAVVVMRDAVARQPNDPWLSYNYAMTLYRAGRYDEAIAAYQTLRQSTDIGQLQRRSALQMGNAQVRLSEQLVKQNGLSGAILSLERALVYYDDATANTGADKTLKHNRELAAARLENYLMQAGKQYLDNAGRPNVRDIDQERHLRNALQAYERVVELNRDNTEAVRNAEEIRERLAANLARQAKEIADQAQAIEADPKRKPEQALGRYQDAVNKLTDAAGFTRDDKPIEQQKQDVRNKMSDLLTKLAAADAEQANRRKPGEDQQLRELSNANGKLDQALDLNAANQKAQDLKAKVAGQLEEALVERGQKQLEAAAKSNNASNALSQLNAAAESFSKAMAINPDNKAAQAGLQEAASKLPDAFANAGDAEAQNAKNVLDGKSPSGAPKPSAQQQGGGSALQDLQLAVGLLEKATQNFGAAVNLAPDKADFRQRADAVQAMLESARGDLDRQMREKMANGQPAGSQPGEPGAEAKAEQADQGGDTQEQLQSMSALSETSKAKPNEGDNFWNRRRRDW